MLHYRWTSINVFYVNDDVGISGSKLGGKVINVFVGVSSNASFGVNSSAHSSDNALSVTPAHEPLRCTMGVKPWILVRFTLCRGEDVIDGYDSDCLQMLGFRTQSKYDVLASADVTTNRSAQDDAVFIHCCCESGILLSRPVSDDRVTIIDVTAADDFTKGSTVRDVIRSIRTAADVFFYCSLCTGGSSWQRLNLELARKKGWKHTVVNMIGHWDLHWLLWTGFANSVRHCVKISGYVRVDWRRVLW